MTWNCPLLQHICLWFSKVRRFLAKKHPCLPFKEAEYLCPVRPQRGLPKTNLPHVRDFWSFGIASQASDFLLLNCGNCLSVDSPLDYPHRLENYLRQKVRKFTTFPTALLRGLSQTAPFSSAIKNPLSAKIKNCLCRYQRLLICWTCFVLAFYARAEHSGFCCLIKGKK